MFRLYSEKEKWNKFTHLKLYFGSPLTYMFALNRSVYRVHINKFNISDVEYVNLLNLSATRNARTDSNIPIPFTRIIQVQDVYLGGSIYK